MPAPRGNQHAAREGVSRLIRIRVPSESDFEIINDALNTEERGQILLQAAQAEWSNTLVIVGDCGRCGEAINAAEPRIYWNGERICESCEDIAIAVRND